MSNWYTQKNKKTQNQTCTHTHTHMIILLLFWNLSGTTRVSRYQKGKTRKSKTNLDLLEQEIVSGSGICWAMYKSAPHTRKPRQHPTTQFFTGRMPFLPPNQQRQSTEGKSTEHQQYLRSVNLTRLTICIKWEKELKLTLSGRLFDPWKKFACTQAMLQCCITCIYVHEYQFKEIIRSNTGKSENYFITPK